MAAWFAALLEVDWGQYIYDRVTAFHWTPRQCLEETTLAQMMVVWKEGREKESPPAPAPDMVQQQPDHMDVGNRLELLNATRMKKGLPPILPRPNRNAR